MSRYQRGVADLVVLVFMIYTMHFSNSFPSELVTETTHTASSNQSSVVTSSLGESQQGGEHPVQDQTASVGMSSVQRSDQHGIVCRVIDLANRTVLKSHPCPLNSICTEQHGETSKDTDTFYCSAPITAYLGPALFSTADHQSLVPCRIINTETNRTELDNVCPSGHTCTKMHDPKSSHSDRSEIFHCVPSAGEHDTLHHDSSVGQFPIRCRVVNKGTTVFQAECPHRSSCDELDKTNSDADTKIYFCTPSTTQHSDHKPEFLQPIAGAGGPQQQHSKRCRVVDKERQEVFWHEECPTGNSCELFDQINSNNGTDVFLCTQPLQTELATVSNHQNGSS